MADKTIEFVLSARDQASRVFENVGDAAEKGGGKISKVGGLVAGFAGGAAFGAISALGPVISDAFAGADDAAKSAALLNNQIKNLGPAGQEAFSTASDFANELGGKIGQDDDDIRKVQAKLASFPDAFGKGSDGADAMRRATKAAFDLQALGIGDANSNIIGIGKALNDPIKGMSALNKSGVSFTEVQKEQIKNAVAHGDLAGAQKILLEGIESNAKNAAEATATNTQKLQVAFGNVTEGLAGAITPALQGIAGGFLDLLPKIQPFLDGVASGFSEVVGWFTKGGDAGGSLSSKLGDTFGQIKATVGPIIETISTTIKTQVLPAFSSFVEAAKPIVSFLVGVLGPVVVTVFKAIGTIIDGALKVISGVLNIFAGLFTGDWSRMWDGIKQVASGAWKILGGLFDAGVAALKAILTIAVETLKAVAGRIWDGIKGAFSSIGSAMGNIGKDIVNGLIGGIQSLGQRVYDAAAGIVNKIPLAVRKLMGIASPSKVMAGLGANIMDGLLVGMDSRTSSVEGFVGDLALAPQAGTFGAGPTAGTLARSGGDTYVIQLPGNSIIGDARHVATVVVNAFEQAFGQGSGGSYQLVQT